MIMIMNNLPAQYPGKQIEKQQDNNYALFSNEWNNQETNLRDYINILKRRKIWIISSLFLSIAIVLFILIIGKPLYKATNTLMIDNVNPNVVPIQEVIEPDNSPNFYTTQY